MEYRTLGRTGLRVSVLAFGAGPVSGLMTGTDANAQHATVAAAVAAGVNWFDTAPGYGIGASEVNLGCVLSELGVGDRIHVATKVRIPTDCADVAEFVRRSVGESMKRLRRSSVALLQLHNGITVARGDETASITPADILGPGGVLDAMRGLQRDGLVRHVGLTATGQPAALREVVGSGEFDTVQVPYNALNPSAGSVAWVGDDTDYGNVLGLCAEHGMGAFAIRVFAGGALLGQTPSAHTLTTPYFPLALYQRDAERARRIEAAIEGRLSMPELAVRFSLTHPAVSSAIIGFGSPAHVEQLVEMPCAEPLPAEVGELL